jgi:predicted nucleic acid-binding protein
MSLKKKSTAAFMENNPTRTWLLDCCTVIHLGANSGNNHDTAVKWVNARPGDRFVLCSVAEGALLRYLPRKSTAIALQKAWDALRILYALPDFEFLDAPDLSYRTVANKGLHGVKQITDAWLAQLARRENMRGATFDKGFVAQHPDVAVLIQ